MTTSIFPPSVHVPLVAIKSCIPSKYCRIVVFVACPRLPIVEPNLELFKSPYVRKRLFQVLPSFITLSQTSALTRTANPPTTVVASNYDESRLMRGSPESMDIESTDMMVDSFATWANGIVSLGFVAAHSAALTPEHPQQVQCQEIYQERLAQQCEMSEDGRNCSDC